MEKLSIRKLQALRKNWQEKDKEEEKAFQEYIDYLYEGLVNNQRNFLKFYEEHRKEWEPKPKSDTWN